MAITDDSQAVAELIAPGFGIEADNASDALESPMTMIGTVEEIAERLEERRERWGFSYHVVQIEDVEMFAPVIVRLAGT